MVKKITSLFLSFSMVLTLTSCSFSKEPEALSGVAPVTVEVQPEALDPSSAFLYDRNISLADSFKQMNSLRASVEEQMYSAVVGFSGSSAWVPEEASKFTLGCDEFLAVSYIMEIEPSITTKKIMREEGFENIEISDLDVENSWKVTATRTDEDVLNNYEFTIRYGSFSDSYRFTRTINGTADMMLASRRIDGGYALQIWLPDGEYHMIANDSKEGRFGYIPRSRSDEAPDFPESDIFFDDSPLTTAFTTQNTEHTFLLANNILYISKDGTNYAIPLK